MKDARSILIRPLLTEKSVDQTTQRKYAFEVATTANKVEIRRAVEQLFPGTIPWWCGESGGAWAAIGGATRLTAGARRAGRRRS